MPFLTLPFDVQLAICARLSPQDILALRQTCRGLHALCCADYVWRQLKIDIPLDLSWNQSREDLGSSALQAIVIKALRLERNWTGNPGCPRKLGRLQHDGMITQIRILGSKWLLTATTSHHHAGSQVSLWSLKSTARHRIFEAQGFTQFSFAFQSERGGILAIVHGKGTPKECLSIFSLILPPDEGGDCIINLCQKIPKVANDATIFAIQASGEVVTAAIARLSNSTTFPSYQFLFINTITGAQRWFNPRLPEGTDRLRFEFLPNRMVLTGVQSRNTLSIYIYHFPSATFWSPVAGEFDESSNGESNDDIRLASQDIYEFPNGFYYHLSERSVSQILDHLCIVVFPPQSHGARGLGHVIRLPLYHVAGGNRVQSAMFTLSRGSTVDYMCAGSSGKRAVWLQRRWDTDEFELMKAGFDLLRGKSEVTPLLPKHLALPFETHACCALAFDEGIGRVCIGLHTGEIYILDF